MRTVYIGKASLQIISLKREQVNSFAKKLIINLFEHLHAPMATIIPRTVPLILFPTIASTCAGTTKQRNIEYRSTKL